MLRSRYTYVQRDGAVLIEDMIGQVSVKNDIATVVIDLVKRGIDVDRVIIVYLDGTGLWDRARTKGGAFACFEVLGEARRANRRCGLPQARCSGSASGRPWLA